jgi:hypothetical protein
MVCLLFSLRILNNQLCTNQGLIRQCSFNGDYKFNDLALELISPIIFLMAFTFYRSDGSIINFRLIPCSLLYLGICLDIWIWT